MTDDDIIRLEVIKAALQGAAPIAANAIPNDMASTEIQNVLFTAPFIAWRMAQQILDIWRGSAPYAPPFKCVHGKTRDEACELCASGAPTDPPPQSNVDAVKVVGVES